MDEFTSKRLIRDVDHIKKVLINLDKTVALQEQNLREHMRRTDLLEQKLEPVEAHVEQIQGVGKFLLYLSIIATIATGIILGLQYLR